MQQDKPDFAIISDEPTPYRMNVLTRIARELPEARLHSLFTHKATSMPWRVDPPPEVNAIFFPDIGLTHNKPVERHSRTVFRAVRDYLVQHNIKMAVLLGYNDLTRMSLIHWAPASGIPFLLTADSNIFSEGRLSPAKRAVKRRFVRYVLNRMQGLMPMGTCGRAFYRLYANHDLPTFLFPYEPDYHRLRDCPPERRDAFMAKHKLDPARRRLLYSGRLVDVKRVDLAIDAFVAIADQRPNWDLVIAGDGQLRAAMEARVPAALRERVRFTGFLQFDETVPCYHSCHALVLPSEYEPWALVVNEAVATGLGVIVTEVVGAGVELVRHNVNGLVIPPRSLEALRRAMARITEPGVCDAMRAAAPEILRHWQQAADPVDGVRQALRHFKVI